MNNKAGKLSMVLVAAAAVLLAGCGLHKPSQIPPTVNQRNAAVEAAYTLRRLAESKDVVVRCNAIEALAQTAGAKEGGLYVQALGDPNAVVQFAAAMAIGDSKYTPAREALQVMADMAGPDKRVYSAVIYALYKLGDTSHTEDLARLLFHTEPEVRADAALVMGKMGEHSGIVPLLSLLSQEQDERVRLQLMESLASLGDPAGKTGLEVYSRTRFVDEQLVAIQAIGRIRPERGEAILEEALNSRQPLVVRIAASGAAARMGDYSSKNYQLCIDAVENPFKLLKDSSGRYSREANQAEMNLVRRLGAISLGFMNRPAAVDTLLPLLRVEDGATCVAAAMSIFRLVPAVSQGTEPAAAAPAVPAAPAIAAPTVAATLPAQAGKGVQAASGPATVPSGGGQSDDSQGVKPKLRSSGAKD
jgi:HEAT repeat protein